LSASTAIRTPRHTNAWRRRDPGRSPLNNRAYGPTSRGKRIARRCSSVRLDGSRTRSGFRTTSTFCGDIARPVSGVQRAASTNCLPRDAPSPARNSPRRRRSPRHSKRCQAAPHVRAKDERARPVEAMHHLGRRSVLESACGRRAQRSQCAGLRPAGGGRPLWLLQVRGGRTPSWAIMVRSSRTAGYSVTLRSWPDASNSQH
jgi:hypothetical protein